MYRSTNAFEKQLTLSSENEMLRENLAATEKELKRLHKDLQVYRSIHAFEQQLSGEGSSAAKRPRADSPEGSGAQP
jgi:5-bromo-4-chloroindolyl phosphate hydrolysis protein